MEDKEKNKDESICTIIDWLNLAKAENLFLKIHYQSTKTIQW
jgi:hypothetical protein